MVTKLNLPARNKILLSDCGSKEKRNVVVRKEGSKMHEVP